MPFVSYLASQKQAIMENNENKEKDKTVDLEQHNIENPQSATQPLYNSTTTHRDSEKLPGVENLNQNSGVKDGFQEAKGNKQAPSAPENDETLHGKRTKTDLGNGQRDDEAEEDEKIIRT